jgi:hypothetical protein
MDGDGRPRTLSTEQRERAEYEITCMEEQCWG